MESINLKQNKKLVGSIKQLELSLRDKYEGVAN